MQYKIDFGLELEGVCTEEQISRIFHNPTNITGVKEGFCSIVDDPQDNTSKVLQVSYPKGIIQEKKTHWHLKFDQTDAVTLAYQVMFPVEFDFVRGGKLPGLYGGSAPRGGQSTNTGDGFSIRIMWRELGVLCSYLYHKDKDPEAKWGKDYFFMNTENKNVPIEKSVWKTMNTKFEDRMYITPGIWHTIKIYIKMNTPGKEDGEMICSLDGKEAVNVHLSFRKDLSFGIDTFAFTSFFGGNDLTWAPTKDEVVYFKDFTISTI